MKEGDNAPVTERLREDENKSFTDYAIALHDHLERNRESTRAKHAEEAQRQAYQTPDTLYMRVLRKVDPVRGLTAYHGECIAGLPSTNMSIQLSMDNLADLLHETKFLFAEALRKSGVEPDMMSAHRRAARCSVELADLVEA